MPLGHPLDPLLPVIEVPNFTKSCRVDITGDFYAKQPLIHLTQSAGSLRFTHSITLEDAEKMAAGLRMVVNALLQRASEIRN